MNKNYNVPPEYAKNGIWGPAHGPAVIFGRPNLGFLASRSIRAKYLAGVEVDTDDLKTAYRDASVDEPEEHTYTTQLADYLAENGIPMQNESSDARDRKGYNVSYDKDMGRIYLTLDLDGKKIGQHENGEQICDLIVNHVKEVNQAATQDKSPLRFMKASLVDDRWQLRLATEDKLTMKSTFSEYTLDILDYIYNSFS